MPNIDTVAVGDVFWFEVNEAAGLHLYFVLTEPENDRVVMVHVTDWDHPLLDTSAVLRPGDHPRIKKVSVAVYKSAGFFSVPTICADVNARRAHKVEPGSDELVRKLQDGLIGSEESSEEVYDYCLDRFPVHPTEG